MKKRFFQGYENLTAGVVIEPAPERFKVRKDIFRLSENTGHEIMRENNFKSPFLTTEELQKTFFFLKQNQEFKLIKNKSDKFQYQEKSEDLRITLSSIEIELLIKNRFIKNLTME